MVLVSVLAVTLVLASLASAQTQEAEEVEEATLQPCTPYIRHNCSNPEVLELDGNDGPYRCLEPSEWEWFGGYGEDTVNETGPVISHIINELNIDDAKDEAKAREAMPGLGVRNEDKNVLEINWELVVRPKNGRQQISITSCIDKVKVYDKHGGHMLDFMKIRAPEDIKPFYISGLEFCGEFEIRIDADLVGMKDQKIPEKSYNPHNQLFTCDREMRKVEEEEEWMKNERIERDKKMRDEDNSGNSGSLSPAVTLLVMIIVNFI